MKFHAILLLLGFIFVVSFAPAQRTDLSGLKFCIDPGHGGHDPSNDRYLVPDPGNEFWESESNFQKALLLKGLLEAKGATVILTRYTNDYPNDANEPTLATRVALANANNVDWFHSIHSNAIGNGMQSGTAVNYTLVLVREKRSPTDPYASTGNGLGVPEREESRTLANILAPIIQSRLRTKSSSVYLDWTFYGGTNGGFSLGVLRGLGMPGELSEGSMHDYAPETRRLLNNDYRKMEAYALRDAFLQYFGVPADPPCIVAGIQSDIVTLVPVNFSQVRLLPENRVYAGDGYNNGFFMFDSLQAGAHILRFETPGRFVDSVQVMLTGGTSTFVDRVLELAAPPNVVKTTPANNDTGYIPNGSITIQFSKPMDTAAVRSAFTISPPVRGTITWNGPQMVFKPDSVLPFEVTFTVRLDTSAKSSRGQTIDGNGDGIPGDPFFLTFRTRIADVFPPQVAVKYPRPGSTVPTPNQVMNFTFNELLKASTVTPSNFALRQVGGSALPRTVEYSEVGGKCGVTLYPSSPLVAGASYQTFVNGVQDLAGNAIASPILEDFSVAAENRQFRPIDSLGLSLTNWFAPAGSGTTVGIDSASFVSSTARAIPVLAGNTVSAELRYAWKPGSADYLIREYLSGGAPKNVLFRKDRTLLQVFLHGDGSGTQFRYAVDDSVDGFPAGAADHHEVSAWITIDWVGWRLVEWDLEKDSVGAWLGNGILEGQLRFDSFQLRKTTGSAQSGVIHFDQLQVAEAIVTGVAGGARGVPAEFTLDQNYPNPFNPSTEIRYSVGWPGHVTIAVYDLLGREVGVLVDGRMDSGRYTLRFDGRGLSSGMYVCRMTAGGLTLVRKMLLTK
jgi:N-acetylmuramoyl-L-alanine amidase